MSKSSSLRARDVTALLKLVGECRDLGVDTVAWREHLVLGLSALVDAEGGFTGEMAGCRALEPRDLGVVAAWRAEGPRFDELDPEVAEFVREPRHWFSQREYHRRNLSEGGVCLTRRDFIDDRTWQASPDFAWVADLFGLDERLWCFRPLPVATPGADESLGLILFRQRGRPDFDGRSRLRVRLACEALAPIVGPRLARFADPSPAGLPPRVRQVLACVLEGDGDKQVAARLGIGEHTVNQYTKALFRHFHVRGRAELLSLWIRRGWGPRLPGIETPEAPTGREALANSPAKIGNINDTETPLEA